MNEDLFLDLLGKDSTLSGRTLIWPYVLDRIAEKPILGWGFYAFWSPLNPLAVQLNDMLRWSVPQAHSGILELLLQIGFVGTTLFLVLWLRNFVLAVKCMGGVAGEFGVSLMLLLIGILVTGVSEEVLLNADKTWTSLFFVMGFICEKQLRLARVARRQVE